MSLQHNADGVLLARITNFPFMVLMLTPYLTTSSKFQRKNKTQTTYFPWTSSWLLITTNKTIILSVIWKEKKTFNSGSTLCNCYFCVILAKWRPQMDPVFFTQNQQCIFCFLACFCSGSLCKKKWTGGLLAVASKTYYSLCGSLLASRDDLGF